MRDACVPDDLTKLTLHWLKHKDGYHAALMWLPNRGAWVEYGIGHEWKPSDLPRFSYLRPVLTPEQEAALHAEIDEMAAALITANEGLLAAWKETGEARREIERLRAALTEATTARDERASETQERDWRVL